MDYFSFSRFGFIVRTDRITEAHDRYTHANTVDVKPGFHYPSSRPEFTARVDGPSTRVHFLTPVNSGRQLGC